MQGVAQACNSQQLSGSDFPMLAATQQTLIAERVVKMTKKQEAHEQLIDLFKDGERSLHGDVLKEAGRMQTLVNFFAAEPQELSIAIAEAETKTNIF
jgi:hypothetical protein